MPNSAPPDDISADNPVEPTSYFQLERRRAGDTKLGGEPLTTPLPTSSPWSGGNPGPGDEPTIDRSEDGDVMGVPLDDLNR
jgi:hypothetical protein